MVLDIVRDYMLFPAPGKSVSSALYRPVIRDAVDIIGTGRYMVVDIDLTGEVAESDGMVCGGTMKVLVEDGSEN